MKRVKALLLIFTIFILLSCLPGCTGNGYIPEPPQGNLTPGHMASSWYDWTQVSDKGFDDFEVSLTVDVDPGIKSYYYWAHQFEFKNGNIGYMGLQTNGCMHGQWVGKMAIFSVWEPLDAEPGPGASFEWFTGEGEGWSCRKKYNWIEGHTYSLRIEKEEVDEKQNRWWGAYIIDTTAGEETFLGRIKVPASWKGLAASSAVWVEYYGKVYDCNSTPYAEARFEQPTANGLLRYSPNKLTNFTGEICPENASIILLQNKGVLFKTGNPSL